MKRFLRANIHHFKTHIARYIRRLERKEGDAIIIERYGKPIALFTLLPPKEKKKETPHRWT